MYTVGCFLAPVIVAPFMKMAEEHGGEGGSLETPCPGNHSHEEEIPDNSDTRIYIVYAYVTAAGIIALAGVAWIYITCVKILDTIRESHGDDIDYRPEEDFCTILPFTIPFVIFFFCAETMEIVYSTYIYDYIRLADNR